MSAVTPQHRMVRDDSTNNPHLVKIVDGQPRALCNARFSVWDAGVVGEDDPTRSIDERVWFWATCPRCEAKADQAVLVDGTTPASRGPQPLQWRTTTDRDGRRVEYAHTAYGMYVVDGHGAGRMRWTVLYPDQYPVQDYGMTPTKAEARAWAQADADQRASR